MDHKHFVLLLVFASVANAQFDTCDVIRTLTSLGQSLTVNHLASYGSCRYLVTSPADTYIEASCSITTTCGKHNFTTSKAGLKELSDGLSYCGNGYPPLAKSIGNEIVVALDNGGVATGSFQCTFTVQNANCDCGWSVNTKIVGGVKTGVNEIVAHAALVDRGTKEKYCGAVIVAQYWSLTAAHCVDAQSNASQAVLLVGDWDTSIGTDTKWAKLYFIASFTRHFGYRADGNLNDIALVKTTDYIRYNYAVGPACLPYTFNKADLVGYTLTAVGWGTTSFGGPTSNVLLKTDLNVISNVTCAATYGSVIDSTKICTYGDGVRDTCGMDSGGGLYYRYQSFRQYVMAIVNYGQYCASKYPSVNSRLTSDYIIWIETTTKVTFCRYS